MAIAQYKCPNCGKILAFKADKQGWFCKCCESLFNDREIKLRFDFNENSRYRLKENALTETDMEFAEKARLCVCKSCGSEFVTDVSTPLEKCVFCGNDMNNYERISGEYCPYKTIPFIISEKEASDAFYKWCGKRKFLPSDYKKNFSIKKIYVPFQTADCVAVADAEALGKKIKIENDKKFRYTKTKEFSVTRKSVITFDGIPADNFSGVSKETLDSIEPFDFNKAVPFRTEHIHGIPVNSPDRNKKIPFQNVKNRCVNMSDNLLRQSMKGYSSLDVSKVDVNIMDTRWKYILLPVWLFDYTYNGKKYEFAVNGQNGRYNGVPPLSLAKLLSLCISAGAVAAFLFILGGILLT